MTGKGGVPHAVGRVAGIPGARAGAQISRAGSAGPAGKASGRLCTGLAAAAAGGFAMQSTDLGNKESGKLWHRKPSPAARDG